MLSRRKFFYAGAGVTSTLVAGSSVAKACAALTAEQPLGPFFPRAGTPTMPVREDGNSSVPIHLANDNDLTFVKGKDGTATGQIVYVKGKVVDGDCSPIANASIIIWQASASGRYNHNGDSHNEDFRHPVTGKTISRTIDPFFQYWGQATSDTDGQYQFKTIVPGFYPADIQRGWFRPPHIHLLTSAVGFPQFVSQLYFRGQHLEDNEFIQQLNARDHLLQNPRLTEQQREGLLIDFAKDPQITDGLVGEFDIVLDRQ